MPRNGCSTGARNSSHARRRYAKAIDETIRRPCADADGTRAGNSQSNPAAVVRSVSAEGAFRFPRRRRDSFSMLLRIVVLAFDFWYLGSWQPTLLPITI